MEIEGGSENDLVFPIFYLFIPFVFIETLDQLNQISTDENKICYLTEFHSLNYEVLIISVSVYSSKIFKKVFKHNHI